MTQRRMVICLGTGLIGLSLASPWAHAGYSSGKSSTSSHTSSSHSTSSSHTTSHSFSSGKGSSYSSGKGSSFHDSSSGSFGSASARAMRSQQDSAPHAVPAATPTPQHRPSTPSFVSPPPPPTPSDLARDRERRFLRDRLDAERYATRRARQDLLYSSYYGRPSVSYHDSYSPWFWLWLMDRPADEQGIWLYHHRYGVDQARYNNLLTQNALLQSQITQLETQNLTRDPTYVPPALADADLMYSDQYVASVAPAPTAATAPSTPEMPAEAPLAPATPMAAEQVAPPPPMQQTSAYSPTVYTSHSDGSEFIVAMVGVLFGGGIVATALRLASRPEAESSQPAASPSESEPLYTGMPPIARANIGDTPPAQVDFNPLHLEAGSCFSIPGFSEQVFRVTDVLQYSNHIGGQVFRFAAYVASPEDAQGDAIQLRVEPGEAGGLNAVALHLHDEMPYDQGLYNIVAVDDTGRFQITDDPTNEVTAEYLRPEGLHTAFEPTVVSQSSGTQRVSYWDYWRTLRDDAGHEQKECLIVEMDQNRYFRIFIGPEIDASCVQVR